MAQGSIVKRGNAYYIVYRLGGKQKWERIGLNRRNAEAVLVERMNLINKGDYREAKRISFADFTAPTTGRYEGFVSKMLAKRPKSCQFKTLTQECKSPKLVKSQGLTRW
jgi:uncharacterized protein YfbU (UPF0304 family)